ncbi:transmembrane protein 79-like isoform X1 [Corythoichthys intestinalis]|uniref:transmembrane protein 79-like isoform X1 n=1 Tax=Corythoichthys intestinalis TaxID=161448 RepID=UPI0025A65F00|nr:transmembrane protein 79-like isoform X1 [Corythoichthys intestinalis]
MDKWASSSDEEARPTGKKATARASRVREKRDLQGDEETRDDGSPATGGRSCAHRDVLKAGVSLVTSAIFFPFLVWGGFVFLPFDAPPLRGAPLRMLYAMRCSVYAAVPVVAGWLAVGVARLRLGVVRPLLGQTEEEDAEGLAVHRRYTRESVGLFLMYFLQLSVTAVYLSQEHLKLVDLLGSGGLRQQRPGFRAGSVLPARRGPGGGQLGLRLHRGIVLGGLRLACASRGARRPTEVLGMKAERLLLITAGIFQIKFLGRRSETSPSWR